MSANDSSTLDDAKAALSEIFDQLSNGAIDAKTARALTKPHDEVIRAASRQLEEERKAARKRVRP